MYTSNDGKLLGSVNLVSIAIDLRTRRPRLIYRELKELASNYEQKHQDEQFKWKPQDFECRGSEIESTQCFQMQTTEKDIDANGHVHFDTYLSFAAYCIEREWDPIKYQRALYSHFNVLYKGEALCGDTLNFRIDRHANQDDVYVSIFKGYDVIVKIRFFGLSKTQRSCVLQSSRI